MIAHNATESSKRAVKANVRGRQGHVHGVERSVGAARSTTAAGIGANHDNAEPAVSALERVAVLGYN